MQRSFLWLLGILLVAALLRFPYADLQRFESEMVRDITLAHQLDHHLILHGILGKESQDAVQQSFGPLYYYLIWISLQIAPTFSSFPLMPYYLTMFLNLLSILLCFFFCKRYFGERVALLSTSLYAVSTWMVIHVSNVFTNPNFLPLFVLLAFFSYYKILVDKKDTYLFLFFVSIAFQLQLHLSALLLLPVYATLFFFRLDLFSQKRTYVYGALAFLLFVPYLLYLFQHHDLSVFSFIGERYESTYFSNFIDALGIPTLFVTPYLGTYLLGDTRLFHGFLSQSLYFFITFLLVLFFGASVFYLLLLARRRFRNQRLLPLLLWLAIPVFLAFIFKKNISPHYLIILLPVPFILLGFFFDFLIKRHRFFLYLFLFFVAYHLFFILFFYSSIAVSGTHGIYGMPYVHKLAVVDYLHERCSSSCVISFYPRVDRSFLYLMELRGLLPQARALERLSDFDCGFLVIDPTSFYSLSRDHLSSEEVSFLQSKSFRNVYSYQIYEESSPLWKSLKGDSCSA